MRSDGSFAEQITRDAHRLEAIKFVWDPSEHQWTKVILPSLEVHAALYGACLVLRPFIVPSEAPWPKQAWGFALGTTVHHIRRKAIYLEQVKRDADRLEAIGFAWDVKQYRWNNLILPGLETFFQIYGHSDVPQNLVVPSDMQWPQQTWGMALGTKCFNIQNRGNYAKQRKQDEERLSAINFRIKKKYLGLQPVFGHAHACCRWSTSS